MRVPRILALVLAGGKGSRLGVLTEKKVKPALPVAGTYRLVDVALSNLVHSHISDVWVVQQYLPHSLNVHLANGRPWDLDRSHGGLQVLPPYEGAEGEGFAEGNADSIYRQKDLIRDFDPDLVLVLSADHLYTINFLDVVDTHLAHGADLTMVTTEVAEESSRYGVVQTDGEGRVTGFDYKPEQPAGRLVAGEMFLYDAQQLLAALEELHEQQGQLEDYGHDLVPWFVAHRTVVEHRLQGYWMDLGTIQSYWTAHLQVLDGEGVTLDDPDWPILSAQPQLVPARIEGSADVRRSMVAAGSTVRGAVEHSVLGPGVVVEDGATVRHSVLLDGVRVGPGVSLVNVVADVGAQITGGSRRGSAAGVTLIGADGAVATTEDFDRSAQLPAGH
ncbi:glucose-1-phosphate adenylyltransferase family protein [Kocuria sp. SM24M-10]|uniref:glucose-1-phosphate adenylyltransferase family protein n=1 Tax=Kocuria sp. SM24M-10 TaxID=1660349 RepID=UPI00064ABDE1|nr:sugar phosphate nucleotidyltransferase [Kocuria sp. SM24M-10]KLU09020.1 glucose-1-phosphate adenylyltransferase [Kocuria sp. SM24M-10]